MNELQNNRVSIKGTFTIFFLLFLLLNTGCSVSRDQKRGKVFPKQFHHQVKFTTLKHIIILPALVEGKTRNFLFDTGAQLSVIQRDSLQGKKQKVSGASNRSITMGIEKVSSIAIGPVEFRSTKAVNGDLIGLKEKVPDFGGLIGQPIIQKANWLIDYPNQMMTVSSNRFDKEGFQHVKIKRKGGSPFVELNILDQTYSAIIDMGSSANLSIPEDHPLAEIIQQKYNFELNSRDVYTLGGSQKIEEQVGTIEAVELGEMRFDNVYTDIRNTSKLRLGMRFFKDCQIVIDQASGDYWIKKE